MSIHCTYCKAPLPDTAKSRFCKGTDCQRKYRANLYKNVTPTTDDKVCPRCKKLKPADEFWVDRGSKDGRSSYCAECSRDRQFTRGRGTYDGGNNLTVRQAIGYDRYLGILERDSGKCQICKIQVTAIYNPDDIPTNSELMEDSACTLDHIIPHRDGGSTEDSNLQVLCRKCNVEKGTTHGNP